MVKINILNTPAKWYLSFTVVFILSCASVLFVHLKHQEWKQFDFRVVEFNHEMSEELQNFRLSLHADKTDSIRWTPDRLQKFKTRVEGEMVDETIDYNLKEVGYVRIQDKISGRILYQSPDMEKTGLPLKMKTIRKVGFQPFEYQTCSGTFKQGIGYWGKRGMDLHYFIGIVLEKHRMHPDSLKSHIPSDLIFLLSSYLMRRANSLYVDPGNAFGDALNSQGAYAYVYQFKNDSIVWTSIPVDRSELFIPDRRYEKDFFDLVKDNQGRSFRQYTEIHDKLPYYNYQVDVLINARPVQRAVLTLFLCSFGGALIFIFIVWGVGWILRKRALRPVDQIIHAVKEITSKNLNNRLPVPESNDEISQLVVTFNELLDRLVKSFEFQKSFMADASHELRTPLSIMMGDIESAIKKLKDRASATTYLKQAISEIEHMARVVEDLHWLANSDAGQIIVNKKHIRLDEVLMKSLSSCQILADKRHIQLSIGEVEILEYVGDEELLVRALKNLVSNAIKYSHPRGKVAVSLYSTDHVINMKVSDNGIGIPKEVLPKIFDRFYRVDRSRSRDTGGSGLGLAIAKYIAEIHSGSIRAESEISKGSTFTLTLPCQ